MGGRQVKLRTRKQLALLCYLAMEQRSHTRDALAELLWPKVTHQEARHSLSTAISGLRGKLGKELFESAGDRFRLRPGVIALDVDRLLQSATDPRSVAIRARAAIARGRYAEAQKMLAGPAAKAKRHSCTRRRAC